MASLIRPTRPYPLPPDADMVDHDSRPHVRLVEAGRRVAYPLTKDRTKYLKPARKWYGQYTDAAGVVRRVPLSANKVAAQQMLAELVRKRERARAGLTDPTDAHAAVPLTAHLAVWEASLRASGAGGKHVRQTVATARRVLTASKAVVAADIDAPRVEAVVAALVGRPAAGPNADQVTESLTKTEAAASLGMTPAAFASVARRHRLAAFGNGKARRFPADTVRAVRALRSAGRATRTANFYLGAVKQFCRWLVANRRMASNPLAHLVRRPEDAGRRRNRRPLAPDELRRLNLAAEASPAGFRGLTGPGGPVRGRGINRPPGGRTGQPGPGRVRPGRRAADRHPGGRGREERQDGRSAPPAGRGINAPRVPSLPPGRSPRLAGELA